MDNGKFSCGVFIDLREAFDAVNHAILLAKLENYGIRGVINPWFRSYLTDRKQTTEIIMLCLRLRLPSAACHKAQSLDHSHSYCTSMISTSPLRYLPFIYLLTIPV